MFCERYFPHRMFARRYWPKIGLTPNFNIAWVRFNQYIGRVPVEPM